MRLLSPAMFVAVAGMAVFALADDTPARKPGLWTITAAAAGEADQVTRFCTDAATDAKMPKPNTAADGQGPCSEKNLRHEGDTITYDTTCTIAGSETTSHVVTTMSDGLVERIRTTFVLNPPVDGMSEGSSTMQWVGACPADMQPGDVETPQGMKLNAVSGKISRFSNKPIR